LAVFAFFAACATFVLFRGHWCSQHPILRIDTRGAAIFALVFSPHADRFFSGSADGKIVEWDTRTGSELRTLAKHDGCVQAIAFSENGKLLASGSSDGKATVYCWRTGKVLSEYTHTFAVTDVTFCSHDELIAVRTIKNEVFIWDAHGSNAETTKQTRCESQLSRSRFTGRMLLTSPDDSLVAEGFEDGRVQVREMNKDRVIFDEKVQRTQVNCFDFSPSSDFLATGGGPTMHPRPRWMPRKDTAVRLWDLRKAQLVAELNSHNQTVLAIAFSRQGTTLASGDYGGVILLWKLQAENNGEETGARWMESKPGTGSGTGRERERGNAAGS